MGALSNTRHQLALAFGITQHGSKATRVDVFGKYQEIFGVEFKTFRVLMNNLIDTIQELNENRRNLSFVPTGTIQRILVAPTLTMSRASMKRMTGERYRDTVTNYMKALVAFKGEHTNNASFKARQYVPKTHKVLFDQS